MDTLHYAWPLVWSADEMGHWLLENVAPIHRGRGSDRVWIGEVAVVAATPVSLLLTGKALQKPSTYGLLLARNIRGWWQ